MEQARRSIAFALLAAGAWAGEVFEAPVVAPHLAFGNLSLSDFDVGHLDADADPDVVISTLFGGVYVSWGDGLGGFSSPQLILSTIVGDVGAGDLDGDGLDDVAYILNGGADVRVLFNLGGGVFGETLVLPTHVKPLTLVIADVNGDGRSDLAVSEVAQVRVEVWTTKLGGGFNPPYDVACTKGPSALAFGDVDGDGWMDLASASSVLSGSKVAVTLSEGGGEFASAATLLDGIDLHPGDSLLVADIDNDGLGDVMLAGQEDGLVVFRGQADALPAAAEVFPTPRPCQSLGAADFDGDRLDDVAAGQEDGLVTLFRQGGGAFLPPLHYAAAVGPLFVRPLDVNLDGHADLLCSNGFVLTPLFGEGGGTFRPCYGFASAPRHVAADDFDGDGLTDFVVALSDGLGAILPGQAGVSLGRAVPVDLGPEARQIFAGAFTADGHPDVLAIHEPPNNYITLSAGLGAGAFALPVITNMPGAAETLAAAAGDLDTDHFLDAVVLLPSGGGTAVPFLGAGDGKFLAQTALDLPGLPVDVVIGDFDTDALPDIAVLSGSAVTTFLGLGGGAFGAGANHALGGGGRAVVAADFDADGLDDLAVVRTDQSQVLLLLANGDASWDEAVHPIAQPHPLDVAAGDLDGDGDAEIVVTGGSFGLEQPSISILLNLQGGAFASTDVALTAGEAISPIVADIGGDGRPDMAVLIPEGFQLDLYANAHPVFEYLGHSLDGTGGLSRLVGAGTLQPDSTFDLLVDGAAPLAPTMLVVGLTEPLLPFKGGVLVPWPDVQLAGLVLDELGNAQLSGTWPAGVPPQFALALQAWCTDPGGVFGFSATAGLRATAP